MKMCSSVSGVEKDRIKATRKKEMFSHEWLSNKKMSFSENAGVWWLIYVEGEGMYCLLCKKCGARSLQNKTESSLELLGPHDVRWMPLLDTETVPSTREPSWLML